MGGIDVICGIHQCMPGDCFRLHYPQAHRKDTTMVEEYGDLWQINADARCITTNGTVRKDGAAVMGRGCAKEAAQRYPELQHFFGDTLRELGNHVHHLLCDVNGHLLSFPVKDHWAHDADLKLIQRSCAELMNHIEDAGWNRVLLPRPGCGNGNLQWEIVKPAIEPLLDGRVVIVSF